MLEVVGGAWKPGSHVLLEREFGFSGLVQSMRVLDGSPPCRLDVISAVHVVGEVNILTALLDSQFASLMRMKLAQLKSDRFLFVVLLTDGGRVLLEGDRDGLKDVTDLAASVTTFSQMSPAQKAQALAPPKAAPAWQIALSVCTMLLVVGGLIWAIGSALR